MNEFQNSGMNDLDQPKNDLDQPKNDLDKPKNDLDKPKNDLDKPKNDLDNPKDDLDNSKEEIDYDKLKEAQKIAAKNPQPNTTFKIDGVKYRTDDNGNIYQVGKNLLPNAKYVLNGYEYQTDKQGRKVKVEGQIDDSKVNHDKRKSLNENMSDIGKGDEKDTDERGHLIADSLGGDNTLGNLIPMDKKLNNGEYKALEAKLAKAAANGDDVRIKVKIEYGDGSNRPTKFTVISTINGEKTVDVFKNGGQ